MAYALFAPKLSVINLSLFVIAGTDYYIQFRLFLYR